MVAEVDIYNMALSRAKVSQRVSSPSENSQSARVCLLWYEHCRDAVLRDFPWPFATKWRALTLLDETVPDWSFVYQYPSDCVYARSISTETGLRNRSWWQDWYQECRGGIPPRIPFKTALSSDGNAQVVLCDLENAWLVHTARVTVTAVFTSDFVDALAWRLTKEIALPLGAKDQDKAAAIQYGQSIAAAWARALNESTPDQKPDSPSIACR